MSWIPPVTKKAVKYGVKYGPQAKVVWDAAGKQVTTAAKAQADNLAARRAAFAEAETVVDGTVLRLVREGKPVWVVYSGDQPLAAYPPPEAVELTVLVAKADLAKRQTPQEYHDGQLSTRAKRAGQRAAQAGTKAIQAGTKAARPGRRVLGPGRGDSDER